MQTTPAANQRSALRMFILSRAYHRELSAMMCCGRVVAERNIVTYFAHSKNASGDWNPLRVHLTAVAERARRFAEVFGAGDDAYLAGLLHDLGKYGDLFQERLRGKESGLDHWSMGASVCLAQYGNAAAAMAVQGHHLGLPWWDERRNLLPE